MACAACRDLRRDLALAVCAGRILDAARIVGRGVKHVAATTGGKVAPPPVVPRRPVRTR